MNELKVLFQHLLDYNERTFMQDIEKKYKEHVNANMKLQSEIEDLKMQMQEVEKIITFFALCFCLTYRCPPKPFQNNFVIPITMFLI